MPTPLPTSLLRRLLIGGTFTALLILLLAYWLTSGSLQRWITPAPPPPRGAIQPFFTTPDLIYPDDPARRDSRLLAAVVADLQRARQRIELAVFDLDLPEIVDALIAAERRGVEVRVVFDSEQLITPQVAYQVGRLERLGIPAIRDQREPFMHHKFIVLDSTVVWAGSWNMTENDTYRNNNNMVRLVSPALAAQFSAEFADLAAGHFGLAKQRAAADDLVLGDARLAVRFSPQGGATDLVVQRLNAAHHQIRLLAFSFTSAPIATALVQAQQRGLDVRAVINARSAGAGAALAQLRQAELPMLDDGNCYLLHHKVLIIDQQTVITGSFNFTGNAEQSNDEHLLVIDDPATAQAFLQEFERIWQQAEHPDRC